MNNKKQIYMVVENTPEELPVEVGSRKEIIKFIGGNANTFKSAVRRGSLVSNKYYVIKIDGYEEVGLNETENIKHGSVSMHKNRGGKMRL